MNKHLFTNIIFIPQIIKQIKLLGRRLLQHCMNTTKIYLHILPKNVLNDPRSILLRHYQLLQSWGGEVITLVGWPLFMLIVNNY